MNRITPFPDDAARRVDVFVDPPLRLYRMPPTDAPSGAAVVYALGAAGVVLLLAIGWVAGILTTIAVLP